MTPSGGRTHTCGALRTSDVGAAVRLAGWAASRRDLGALVFIDLRDRYGITQLAFDEETAEDLRVRAGTVKPESVLSVEGVVRPRPEGQVNADRVTGEVEVAVTRLEVLAPSATPPFEIDAEGVGDELRLQYRYLDLRRPGPLATLRLRHELFQRLRCRLSELDFLEVETPVLTKATPEGARDYLVPSRTYPGRCFALPQSPQLFKQLLMVAGLDKYFQIVKCFRDEDLRADRQPEFTQLDMEMSFAEEADVQAVVSDVVAHAVNAVRPGVAATLPFPRLCWDEAMARYGSDKPDTRFSVELHDVGHGLKDCGFGVFEKALLAGGCVRALAAPAAFSRKDVRDLEAVAVEQGARGLAWARVVEGDGGAPGLDAGFAKFLSPEATWFLIQETGAQVGHMVLAVADSFQRSAVALGAVRLEVGRRLGLIDPSRWNFLWVTDFPMFEQDEETGKLSPAHHPFCMPREAFEGQLEKDPASLVSRAYDLVLNGSELGSGSVRIHDSALQRRVFDALGLEADVIESRFGWVLEAFRYGAPPHAGFAVGLDRLVMLLSGASSLREVIAFPKTTTAACPLTGAPTVLPAAQLAEVGVAVLDPGAAQAPARGCPS